MPHLISYDITNDSLRQKIANKLIEHGMIRLQYSVFLGTLQEYQEDLLIKWLSDKISTDTSNKDKQVLVLKVTKKQVKNMLQLGNQTLDKDDLTDEIETLIF